MNAARFSGGASRREFLRGGFRYSLLATLGFVSATLYQRNRASLSNQSCISQGICRGCVAFSGCGLPPALSVRQALASPADLPARSSAKGDV